MGPRAVLELEDSPRGPHPCIRSVSDAVQGIIHHSITKKSRIWTLLMGSHTGPYQTSLFCRRFLSDSLLVNSSDISVSGSCCLNCSQRTAPITQLRLQYFESLATFSKHWIAAIWQLLRCSTYLPRLTVSTTSCYFVDWQRLQSSYGIRSTVLDWFTSYLEQRVQYVRFTGRSSTYPFNVAMRGAARFGLWTNPFSFIYC